MIDCYVLFQPPPAVLKLNIFGEIVSGKNFEYDDIYVYYSCDLADSKFRKYERNINFLNFIDWYVEPSMTLSGYTQTASVTKSSKYVSEDNLLKSGANLKYTGSNIMVVLNGGFPFRRK